MAKVKNVAPGLKFKAKSGEVYLVIEPVGISTAGSKLWRCNNGRSDSIFAEWAILDQKVVMEGI